LNSEEYWIYNNDDDLDNNKSNTQPKIETETNIQPEINIKPDTEQSEINDNKKNI
jgi:hypothetical protein